MRDKMRSKRYKGYNNIENGVYDKAGSHGIREYPMKGHDNLEIYKIKNYGWWFSINRVIEEMTCDFNSNELLIFKSRKIRHAEKYEM